MAVDLSPYKKSLGERPISSSKQNNLLTAIQNNLNSLPPSQLQGYPGNASVYLDGTGHWTTPSPPTGGFLLVKYTQKEVLGTDVSLGFQYTDLLNHEFLIPAGTLTANGAIKFWAAGDYLNNSGAAAAVQPYITLVVPGAGGAGDQSPFAGGSSDSVTASATRHAWWCHVIINARGATNAQLGGGYLGISDRVAATTGQGRLTDPYIGGASAGRKMILEFDAAFTTTDMTQARQFEFHWNHSPALATLSARLDWARLEVT
jgi:hypothetical protein